MVLREIKHSAREPYGKFLDFLKRFSFWLSLAAVCTIIFDVGFAQREETETYLVDFYLLVLLIGILDIFTRYLLSRQRFPLKVRIFDGLIVTLYVLLLLLRVDYLLDLAPWLDFLNKMGWLYLAVFIYFIREFSDRKININRERFNPAQLFIMSFLGLVLLGTLLLMLPKATYEGLSAIDALFTATSAVCVTGLAVVDTGTYFTPFGQFIILLLIQIGGLGIMTFASYFSYFFRGKSSYENQLMLKDMTNSEKLGEVFSVLKKIIFVTFAIELLGAVLIFISLERPEAAGIINQIFFSVFHAVSAFCNAGFSTLTGGLYEAHIRFNYPFQLIIAFLLILGGIGFPIVFNLSRYFIYAVKSQILRFSSPSEKKYLPWILNLNTRLVLSTTAILLLGGTLLIFILEYYNTLAEHGFTGKVVTAFFTAATPRTAGFNSVDFASLNFPTIMLIFLLMWIGGSPASTGGGIKTSTFAIAILNFISLAKGRNRIEVFRREIADISVRRAFAIISLSLVVIGLAIILIAHFDREKTLLAIAFECFSAYSTVGLSLGITAALSMPGKIVIIITMFVGRVSMLTIMIALLRRIRAVKYRYPKEEILMN